MSSANQRAAEHGRTRLCRSSCLHKKLTDISMSSKFTAAAAFSKVIIFTNQIIKHIFVGHKCLGIFLQDNLREVLLLPEYL